MCPQCRPYVAPQVAPPIIAFPFEPIGDCGWQFTVTGTDGVTMTCELQRDQYLEVGLTPDVATTILRLAGYTDDQIARCLALMYQPPVPIPGTFPLALIVGIVDVAALVALMLIEKNRGRF